MKELYNGPLNKTMDFANPLGDGKPASGLAVQNYIKNIDASKFGVGYATPDNKTYLFFADATDRDAYLLDSSKIELIKGVIDLSAGGSSSEIEDDPELEKLVLTIGNDRFLVNRERLVVPNAPILTADGTFTFHKNITMYTSTSGAQIRYTIGIGKVPEDPTVTTGVIGTTIDLAQNLNVPNVTYYIKAIAVKNGLVSLITAGVYTINSVVPTVTFSNLTGDESSDNRTILLSCENFPGASIKYTDDGTDPKTSNTAKVYDGICVTLNTCGIKVIKAYAYKEGYVDSDITQSQSIIVRKLPEVTIACSGNQSSENRIITLSHIKSNTIIKYKINNDSYNIYSEPITLSVAGTYSVTVLAELSGWTTSEESSLGLIVVKKLVAPGIIASGDKYSNPRTVTMSASDTNAEIYYTSATGGAPSSPTSSSTKYTNPIVLSTAGTVNFKAITVRTSWTNSDITSLSVEVAKLPMYYGYGNENITASQITELPNIKSSGIPAGTYTLTRTGTAYMWICIDPIFSINKIKSGGFDVDMLQPLTIGQYKCYRTTETIESITFTIE